MIDIKLNISFGFANAGVPVSNITCLIYFKKGSKTYDLLDYALFKWWASSAIATFIFNYYKQSAWCTAKS